MPSLLPAALAFLALGGTVATAADAPALPPAEEAAKARLGASPRHGEWVSVDVAGTPVRTWVVHPERSDDAPVVVIVHEIFGLTDWIRAVADQLAADGFLAVAPDLLSGKGRGGGGTETFAGRDDAVKAVSGLARDEVLTRLDVVRAHALALPSATGRSAAIGFCWGGATTFAWALRQPALDAAVVYYGAAPQERSAFAKTKTPVLGLYGGDDARVNSTIAPTQEAMRELGNPYETHLYEGAGHGFLRAQAGQGGANRRASEQAWPLTLEFLRRRTR